MQTRAYRQKRKRSMPPQKALSMGQRNLYHIKQKKPLWGIWHDRNKRILIANRKTEKILQTFLAKWLSENIHDARVASEVGKISGVDRTDIELTSIHTGDNIIIEVKWMGENASKTSHDTEILEQGIRQVCTYLDREPNALEGCVVCYDGRQTTTEFSLDEPIAKLEYRIVWLESRSGSQIGAEG